MILCPRCGGTEFWNLSTGQRRCRQCGLTRKFDRTPWDTTRISPYWKGRLLEYFCLGVPAYRLRYQVPANPKTVLRYFRLLRETIYRSEMSKTMLLLENSRIRGYSMLLRNPFERTWSLVEDKVAFGVSQVDGKILTYPLGQTETSQFKALVSCSKDANNIFMTSECDAYICLDGRRKSVSIKKDKTTRQSASRLSGIEGFWSYARQWIRHYRGIPGHHFHLYLKEIEWRFNNHDRDLTALLRKLLSRRGDKVLPHQVFGQSSYQLY
jgi:transposase